MNLLASAMLLLALAQSETSALVEASKDARSKRKGSTTKVITNAYVAKANKGKVKERKGVDTAPIEPTATLMEKHNAERKARLEREAKLKTLNETIAKLEAELAKLEQQYYEENDLDRRDRELVPRFNETKQKLDDARQKLAAISSQLAGPTARPES
jgi:DNA repair exonuclease SbcCD ATPase subunit